MQQPQYQQIYKHYKGDLYMVYGIGNHSETLEPLVIYHKIKDQSLWVRPLTMFCEKVQVNDCWVDRFMLVDDNECPSKSLQ